MIRRQACDVFHIFTHPVRITRDFLVKLGMGRRSELVPRISSGLLALPGQRPVMTRKPRRNAAPRRSGAAKSIWPALLAVGSGMTAGSAAAIELGPIEVHSKLGHPLRASIAFALGPNESIAANCVSLRSGASDFPVVFGARVSVANGVIALSGNTPINEPLMSANLVIDCPYTAHVSRNFTVFLDPSFERASVTAQHLRPLGVSRSRVPSRVAAFGRDRKQRRLFRSSRAQPTSFSPVTRSHALLSACRAG